MKDRCFFDQDQFQNWYIVDEDFREGWREWVRGQTSQFITPPRGASRIRCHPSLVTFELPLVPEKYRTYRTFTPEQEKSFERYLANGGTSD